LILAQDERSRYA